MHSSVPLDCTTPYMRLCSSMDDDVDADDAYVAKPHRTSVVLCASREKCVIEKWQTIWQQSSETTKDDIEQLALGCRLSYAACFMLAYAMGQ